MERTKGPQKPSQIRRDASGRFAKPDALVVEQFPASQQGAWTQAGKERRKAELDRRRQQLAPLSLDREAEIETALDVGATFPRFDPSKTKLIAASTDFGAFLDLYQGKTAALDVDPDAAVRAWYDAIPTMGNGHKWIFTFDELAESAKALAREDYLSIRALTPEPEVDPVPPEVISASPAPTSQAMDTLAVTEYREPEPADYEQEPSRLVFGLWCAIAGAATVAVVAVCLQAMGVL